MTRFSEVMMPDRKVIHQKNADIQEINTDELTIISTITRTEFHLTGTIINEVGLFSYAGYIFPTGAHC